MKTKNKRNKIKKKSSEIIKKLSYYFFYLRKYPQALIKSPFYLLRYGPKKFWQKVKTVEKIVELVNPQWSFHFLQLISLKKIIKALKILFTKGPKGIIEKIKEKQLQNYYNLSINQQYQIWLKKNYPTKKELERQKKESKKFKYQPKISLITPVYNPEKNILLNVLNRF